MASGLTATYLFPYPLQTDAVDVAAEVQSLAQAIETTMLLKAPLLSPALTGTPTAPTPADADNTTKIATTAFVKNQLYLTAATAASTYAPIASPTLTGTPAAPTAAVNTSTTQIATTAFVNAEISNDAVLKAGSTMTGGLVLPAGTTGLVPIRIPHGTAPSSPTDGDIWTTTVGMYARINGNTVGPFGTGATYTGSAPTAITGALWANSTYNSLRVYTGSRWASMDGVEVPAAKTASYTLALGDDGTLIQMAGATTNAITVPTNASVAFPIGSSIMIAQTSAVQTVISGAGVTFLATPGLKLRTQNSAATLIKVATDTWLVVGDLAA